MNTLIWYRNDLRTSDHEGLQNASDSDRVIAVYFFDPRHYEISEYGFKKTEKFRAQFLIETIQNLKKNLADLNIPLIISTEKTENEISKICNEYSIDQIHLQKEWTSEEIAVEEKVQRTVPKVKFEQHYEQFLYHPDDIPFEISKIPKVFTDFRKACEKKSEVRDEIAKIDKLPKANFQDVPSEIPTLQQLGLADFEKDKRTAHPFKGGEDEAKTRLKDYTFRSKNLASYKKTRNGLIGEDYSSKLSAFLANGSISAKQIYHTVKRFEQEHTSNQSTYWLIFELIWRDFFKYVSLKHGNKLFQIGGILDRDLEWKHDESILKEWISGKTKEPFVNANMKEIEKTGFMSNRGRQNVNSFLAKEQRFDWRYGAAYFESMLVDYDVHSNWGNWMYNSGVGNDPRDRKFNIKSQADRYDPDGEYQKLWLND